MDKTTYVTVDGKRLANVSELSVRLERDWEFADSAVKVVISGLSVSFTRSVYPTGATDGISLRTLSNFTLKIHTPRQTSTFSGCQWIDFQEITEENRIVEKVKIVASNYGIS
jgi:hypothetical protein